MSWLICCLGPGVFRSLGFKPIFPWLHDGITNIPHLNSRFPKSHNNCFGLGSLSTLICILSDKCWKKSYMNIFISGTIALVYTPMEDTLDQSTATKSPGRGPRECDASQTKSPARGPQRCGICDKMCASRAALEIHYRTHTGERPYTCSVCFRAFKRKEHMLRHLGTHCEQSLPLFIPDTSQGKTTWGRFNICLVEV